MIQNIKQQQNEKNNLINASNTRNDFVLVKPNNGYSSANGDIFSNSKYTNSMFEKNERSWF